MASPGPDRPCASAALGQERPGAHARALRGRSSAHLDLRVFGLGLAGFCLLNSGVYALNAASTPRRTAAT
jgi:hypothetical protein